MDKTNVSIRISSLHCTDEGDGPGSAEPYLWTAFFKVDGDTVTAAQGTLQGTATVVGTPGNHGDLNTTDVNAGDTIAIPAALGQFSGLVTPIPGPNGTTLPAAIGYIATLLEQDSTPDHAIATGHEVFNKAVQTELNKLLPTLRLTDLTNLGPVLEPLKQRIGNQVATAIRNAESTTEIITNPNQDDNVGTDVRVIFAQGDKIGTDPTVLATNPLTFEQRIQNEGDWTISAGASVVPSQHVFLKIVGRAPNNIPIAGSGPLAGVSVQLFELDNPAPAGDDVVIPPTGETEQIVGNRDITDSRTYAPVPDQALGTLATDTNGIVAFQVWTNARAGILTHTRTIEDLRRHTTSTTTTQTVVGEAHPDYGVTVVGHSGRRLATRQLVQLNANGNVGTAANPLVVLVDPDQPVVVAQGR